MSEDASDDDHHTDLSEEEIQRDHYSEVSDIISLYPSEPSCDWRDERDQDEQEARLRLQASVEMPAGEENHGLEDPQIKTAGSSNRQARPQAFDPSDSDDQDDDPLPFPPTRSAPSATSPAKAPALRSGELNANRRAEKLERENERIQRQEELSDAAWRETVNRWRAEAFDKHKIAMDKEMGKVSGHASETAQGEMAAKKSVAGAETAKQAANGSAAKS